MPGLSGAFLCPTNLIELCLGNGNACMHCHTIGLQPPEITKPTLRWVSPESISGIQNRLYRAWPDQFTLVAGCLDKPVCCILNCIIVTSYVIATNNQ